MDLSTLSLSQKIAQLIVVRASGHLFDQQIAYPQWEAPRETLQHWIQDRGIGGVILLGGSAAEIALRTQQIQAWGQQFWRSQVPGTSGNPQSLPLLMAADVEEGVGQRFAGAHGLPPPFALGAIADQDLPGALHLAQRYGGIIAAEAQAIGLNWILAPVVDVNNNPDNPVINIRSFGEDPQVVSALAQAFIQGCQPYPVLTTAKHFPGHGDTSVDSHLDLPVIPHDRSRLENLEWKPFQAAIAAQVSSIMTAHLLLPALDEALPATLSPTILTTVLRQTLGFEGLIVTDALIMEAICQRYGPTEAPIRALEAGADVILMPVNPEETMIAIAEAVETGRLTEARLDQSLARIWRAKQSLNAGAKPPEPSSPASQVSILTSLEGLHSADADTLSRTILQRSNQIQGPALPHPSPPVLNPDPNSDRSQTPVCPGYNLILVDNLWQSPFLGAQTPAWQIPASLGYRNQVLDHNSAHLVPVPQGPTLLQLFVRGNPFRGTGGIPAWMLRWLEVLLQEQALIAIVVYGSPYAWETLKTKLPDPLPQRFSYGQMPIAQEIVLQTLLPESPLLRQNQTTLRFNLEFTT